MAGGSNGSVFVSRHRTFVTRILTLGGNRSNIYVCLSRWFWSGLTLVFSGFYRERKRDNRVAFIGHPRMIDVQ